MNKSTHNRRERPIHGHRGGSRGRFYYRITTFEERPWDARDPHKTTFMAFVCNRTINMTELERDPRCGEGTGGLFVPRWKESWAGCGMDDCD